MKKQSELVRGAGVFINFFSVLTEELTAAGGQVEMLYFAQKEHARPMMKLLAKTIVESGLWKIPASIVLREIEETQKDTDYLQYDKIWSWTTFSSTAESLTTLRFVKNGEASYHDSAQVGIPQAIAAKIDSFLGDKIDSLVGELTLPPVISYEGKDYIITYYDRDALYLAPAEYFDLEN